MGINQASTTALPGTIGSCRGKRSRSTTIAGAGRFSRIATLAFIAACIFCFVFAYFSSWNMQSGIDKFVETFSFEKAYKNSRYISPSGKTKVIVVK